MSTIKFFIVDILFPKGLIHQKHPNGSLSNYHFVYIHNYCCPVKQYKYKGGNYLLWLHKIGYAEDPRYVCSVIRILRDYL